MQDFSFGGGGGLPYAGTLYSTGWAPAPQPDPFFFSPFPFPTFPQPFIPNGGGGGGVARTPRPRAKVPSCQDEKNALHNCLQGAAQWHTGALRAAGIYASGAFAFKAISGGLIEGAIEGLIKGRGTIHGVLLGALVGTAESIYYDVYKKQNEINDQYLQKVMNCNVEHPLEACHK